MRKRIIIGAIIVAALAVVGAVWATMARQARYRPARDVLASQRTYVDRIWKLIEELDSATTLYVTGSIDKAAWGQHLDIADAELAALRAVRKQDMEEHPVAVGSHTYATKAGIEAVDGLYADTGKLISAMRATTDAAHASYTYMAWHQAYADRLARFAAALEEEGIPYSDPSVTPTGTQPEPQGTDTRATAPDTVTTESGPATVQEGGE